MNILIVDDDDLIHEAYSAPLRERGHLVTCTDGVGALRELDHGPWDALLVDILMPDTDGIEVIKAAGNLPRRPRIVAMSGGGLLTADDCLAMAGALGADLCLRKPVNLDDLADALTAA